MHELHMHQGNLFVILPWLHLVGSGNGRRSHVSETTKKSRPEELVASLRDNPEGAAARGLWSDNDFLRSCGTESEAKHTQFTIITGMAGFIGPCSKHDRQEIPRPGGQHHSTRRIR